MTTRMVVVTFVFVMAFVWLFYRRVFRDHHDRCGPYGHHDPRVLYGLHGLCDRGRLLFCGLRWNSCLYRQW